MSHRKFERKPRAHDMRRKPFPMAVRCMSCLTPIMGRVMMLSHTARLETLQQRPLPEFAQSSNIGDLAFLAELHPAYGSTMQHYVCPSLESAMP